ncbi:hypothetical protein EGI26_06705 [Lacihabitans sp. CCS-44]|uniref:hypothetical protein n=1 Tax=Lacihabitans sp. CCS-44 TaxID=2487331 RepID=UPI0020CE9554|nr:hypothetical protein [Lacihabitans sp. CCS-44]MCP9754851.1 hypothetical protein [Lacihabitans sp. CCS-44]
MKIKANIDVITENFKIHYLDIDKYDNDIILAIKNNITKICNGIAGDDDIEVLKIEIRNWFVGKDESKKHGFIAEFFCHLYLNQLHFEQHFLFKNLEETKSMKKGFDGLYEYEGEIFLYESKSSLASTATATHNGNISEAYRDLRDKLNGSKKDVHGNPIDPWSNAVNHASLQQVNPNKTLIQNLGDFKKQFIKGLYSHIRNFNVIPSSTIYLGTNWKSIDRADLKTKLFGLVSNYEFKKINILCINKKAIDDFITYINT